MSSESVLLRQQCEKPILYDDPNVTCICVKDVHDKFIDLETIKSEYVKMLPSPSTPFESLDSSAGLKHSSLIRSLLFERLEAAAKNFNMFFKTEQFIFMVSEGLRTIEDAKDVHGEENFVNIHKATGGVVSFRVYDKTKGEFLDMADNEHLTFSRNLTTEQKKNRQILLHACDMAGLVNYSLEWWTYCFGTQYYSYLTQNKFAIFPIVTHNSQIVKK